MTHHRDEVRLDRHHGEALVRQKKSEGIPPSRGKPTQGPGGAEAYLPPVKGGNPLTGVQGISDKVDHKSLVRSLSQGAAKKRLVGETQKLAEAARLTNLQSSVASSTAKNYAYWWSRFRVFCDQIDAIVMPFSSETAGLFLSHLAETALLRPTCRSFTFTSRSSSAASRQPSSLRRFSPVVSVKSQGVNRQSSHSETTMIDVDF